MGSVIKLGTQSTLRNYSLKQINDSIAWRRGPANPFAAKINASGNYDRVDIWNEWVQEDWQQGVGRVDPQAGGFLYGEVETRVPGQMILSPLVRQVDKRLKTSTIADCRYMPDDMASEVAVGAGGHVRVAMKFTTPASGTPSNFMVWFYAQIAGTVQVAYEIWSDSSGPSAKLSTTVNYTPPEDTFGWYWHGAAISYALANSTSYWIVIYPTNPLLVFYVGYGTSGYNTVAKRYNGTSWADVASMYLLHSTSIHRISTVDTPSGAGFFRLGGNFYCYSNCKVYEYSSVNDNWVYVDDVDNLLNITGVTVFGQLAYFSDPIFGGNMTTMDSSEVFTYVGSLANFTCKYGPYIYRAVGNDLYYSADVALYGWEGPFAVGEDEYTITGMAGMGDSLYVATGEALYRFAPGHIVEGVTTWGSLDATNGLSMLDYQGSIYCCVNGRVVNFTQDGRVSDIWIGRDDDILVGRIGKVQHLSRMNNWLIAVVANESSSSKPSVWALQDGNWHHIATLPTAAAINQFGLYGNYSAYYDRGTRSLWVMTTGLVSYRLYVPDYAINPYNDGGATYMPRGWFEQDRFYGGQYLIDKDFESVTIIGDNLSATCPVIVCWQDEASVAWETLGAATADGQELRWSNHTTRPQGRWIKLGLLLFTKDGDETPRIRAVVVKNLPMVTDRVRDSVTLTLKTYIEMPDGAPDAYTRAEQLAHIQSMIGSVIPIIYEDPLGVQYEVKVVDYSFDPVRFIRKGNANEVAEIDVALVLEQVPDSVYTP